MRIPGSTYRLQFSPDFTFKDAQHMLSYLHDLGVTDIYASPVFQANPGSNHGYDITDYSSINTEFGGEKAFLELLASVRNLSMGWIQDIVPNHMAYSSYNPFLMDVFRNEKKSRYYSFFDIDWETLFFPLKQKVLAPFLDTHLRTCLKKKEICIFYNSGEFFITYKDLFFPLHCSSYNFVFSFLFPFVKNEAGENDFYELKKIAALFAKWEKEHNHRKRDSAYNQAVTLFEKIYNENDSLHDAIDMFILNCNTHDDAFIKKLLSQQVYSLASKNTANLEINYRRFFTINGLIGINPTASDFYFSCIMDYSINLLKNEKITGLRIDHIDGLFEPGVFLRKIRKKADKKYIIVEKVLFPNESLPESWNVQGTPDYAYLNKLNGIFHQRENKDKFQTLYERFTKKTQSFKELVYKNKRDILQTSLRGEIKYFTRLYMKIMKQSHRKQEFHYKKVEEAIMAFLEYLPVYRTYISTRAPGRIDNAYCISVFRHARIQYPEITKELQFLKSILCDNLKNTSGDLSNLICFFRKRLQQFSPAVMAKGLEDTTLYCYNRLLSLNEVGGWPENFGVSVPEFHAYLKKRNILFPYALNSTSTHDTKRGEDVRMRLAVLSELPEEWEKNINAWRKINKPLKTIINHCEVPDRNEEYFLYQTVLGTFSCNGACSPTFINKINKSMIKSLREAKRHTSWQKPDSSYEKAVLRFIQLLLDSQHSDQFLKTFLPFHKKIAYWGALNSLSQTTIKIISPGVPDIYQGTDLWEYFLVDPDNRRQVDFGLRKKLLSEIKSVSDDKKSPFIKELLQKKEHGEIKLFLLHTLLQFRKNNHLLFQYGDYIPLQTHGKYKDSLFSFCRVYKKTWILCVVPRYFSQLISSAELPVGEKLWQDTSLQVPLRAPEKWQNILTGEIVKNKRNIPAATMLMEFPVGVFVNV